MAGRTRRELPAELARGAVQFSQWRQTRELGTRIPARLWKLAVDLAVRHGVSRTATALQVSYYDLRKHLAARRSAAGGREHSPAPETFVQLSPAPWSTANGCVIEFEQPSGAKLRVQLSSGSQLPDLIALARSFCEAE